MGMNLNDDDLLIIDFCKKIIDHPNHAKLDDFDTYTVFRYITNITKSKKKQVDTKGLDLNLPFDENLRSEYEQLVKKINPFYNFKDSVKNKYYEFNFMLAAKLTSQINTIKKSRHLPHMFLIFNPETEKYMSYDDFNIDCGNGMSEAVFYEQDRALAEISKFLNVYSVLSINKGLQLHAFNLDKKLLYSRKFETDFYE